MSTLTLPNGTVLTQVTRQSCLDRLAAIPLGSIPYSHTITPVTGRRADCTGLVSEVWATPEAGQGKAYTSGSFYTEDVVEPIGWTDLRPGDIIGYLAPNSPGNGGHAAIWIGGDKKPLGRYHVIDHGSGDGPKDRWVQWTGDPDSWMAPTRPDGTPGLAPWRYVGIIEEGDDMLTDEQAVWLEDAYRIAVALANGADTAKVHDFDGKLSLLPFYDKVAATVVEQLTPPSGGNTEVTLDGIRTVFDEELDEAFKGGADTDA